MLHTHLIPQCEFCHSLEPHPDETTTVETDKGEFVICAECVQDGAHLVEATE